MEFELTEIEKERDYMVVKSNILVLNARYQYSLSQQKIIAYICSKIKPITTNFEVKDRKYQLEYQFEISEYLKLLGVESSGNQYAIIKNDLQSLSDKSMWIPIEDENGKGETLVRWCSKVTVYKKSGKVKIKLDEDLVPYLFELQEKYLSYGLINILNFKSKYSIRMYELLKSYYDMKRSQQKKKRYETPIIEWVLDLAELKHILNITSDNTYRNFTDFRRKVLEISQQEINELSDMKFEFEPITKGRKTVKVKFLIEFKDVLPRFICDTKNRELLGRK